MNTKSRFGVLLSFVLSALLVMGIPLQAFADDVPLTDEELSVLESETTQYNEYDEYTGDGPATDVFTYEDYTDGVVEDTVEVESGLTIFDTTGWTPVTSLTSEDITTFAITAPIMTTSSTVNNLVGHITLGAPGQTPLGQSLPGSFGNFYTASYYVTYDDTDGSHTITYGYDFNEFDTSYFTAYYFDNSSSLQLQELGDVDITSVWTKTIAPGYESVQFVGTTVINDVIVEIALILTPDATGKVTHTWRILNNSIATTLEIGFLANIDTKLGDDDNVPVYSLGTGKGLYIADEDTITSVSFPSISPSDSGPTGYAAGNYSYTHYTDSGIFGADLTETGEMGISRNFGDEVLSGVDSIVLFRWNMLSIAPGQTGTFAYAVALAQGSDTDPDVQTVVPATGDTSTLPLTIALGLTAIGCVLLAIGRRFWRLNS